MSKQNNVLPISVFGWPGAIPEFEKTVCEMSVLYDPKCTTMIQMAKPDRAQALVYKPEGHDLKDDDKVANILLYQIDKRKKFGFYILKDGSLSLWTWSHVMKYGYNASLKDGDKILPIPEDIMRKTIAAYEAWTLGDETHDARELLPAHLREDINKDQFVRLVQYIRTLGRAHGQKRQTGEQVCRRYPGSPA